MLEIIVGALILLAGVIIGFALASAKAAETDGEMTTTYNGDVINNYGEMPQELTYDEGTLFKVRKVLVNELAAIHLNDQDLTDIITGFQNEGILFRERAK